MKKILGTLVLGAFLVPACLVSVGNAEDKALSTDKEKLSYSMGMDLGKYLNGMKDKIEFDVLKQGIEDGYSGVESKLSEDEIKAVQQKFAADMQAEKEAELAEMKTKNMAAGQAFLEENKKKEGVKVTESGLQYEVLEAADGEKPKASDTVKVDYVGTLVDGTEFDSSIKRGEPAVFPVDKVIPGWTEALQLMEVGSKYRVVIPAELAYGDRGAPPVIEPNSVLVFEISLLDIQDPAEEGAPAKE